MTRPPDIAIQRFRDIGYAVSRATGCHWWLGSANNQNYGRFAMRIDGVKKMFCSHRVSLYAAGIAIPEGKVVDHLCRNTLCVNPKHLDICTNEENTKRGAKGKRWESSTCRRGHKFTPENTTFYGRSRVCKTCRDNFWPSSKKANKNLTLIEGKTHD